MGEQCPQYTVVEWPKPRSTMYANTAFFYMFTEDNTPYL
jgi:hypothetical protein